jgi:cytochrome c553
MKTSAMTNENRIVLGTLARLAAYGLAIISGTTLWLAPSVVSAQADLTYKIYCARCHGDSGHGDGADAATFKTHPRDFSDCAAMTKISDDTMFKAIKDGGAAVGVSGDMPAWGAGLSDDDIHSVMKFIRHFCAK